jgi:uncharacterized protein (DUF433 family)
MKPENEDEFLQSPDSRYRFYSRSLRRGDDFMEFQPFRWMFERCRQDYPGISLDEAVLGGIPHLDGTRLSVGQVLGRLYMLGSLYAVAKYYSELGLTEEQVKEAIGFSQDFMELAGDPYQSHD